MGNWADGHDQRDEMCILKNGDHYNSVPRNSLIKTTLFELTDDFQRECNAVARDLHEIVHPLSRDFEQQRRNIGAGFGVQNEIIHVSKKGMVAVRRFDRPLLEECIIEFNELWYRLQELKMPAYKGWEFDANAAQEIWEFYFVSVFYPILVDRDMGFKILSFDPEKEGEICTSPQAWLAGLGDAVGEVGKLLYRFMATLDCNGKNYLLAVKNLRIRFLYICEIIHGVLERFETAYGMVINNSHYAGFRNTYRGLLQQVEWIQAQETQKLVDDRCRLVLIDQQENFITRIINFLDEKFSFFSRKIFANK